MAEQIRHYDEPKILDVEELGGGNFRLNIQGAKARDIFATLRFHEPDAERSEEQISFLFDKAVELGMLGNATVVIDDPASGQGLEGVTFTRKMKFGDKVTPEQARNAFLAAYQHEERHAHDMETRILSGFIDAGRMPKAAIVFYSNNEIVNAQPEALVAELSELTERHYEGQDLGGPAVGN